MFGSLKRSSADHSGHHAVTSASGDEYWSYERSLRFERCRPGAPATVDTVDAQSVRQAVRMTVTRLSVVLRGGSRVIGRRGLAGVVDLMVVAGLWVGAEVAVRTLPLQRTARVFGAHLAGARAGADDCKPPPGERPLTEQPPSSLTVAEEERVRLAQAVGRLWPAGPGPCLRQSLVTARLLRRMEPRLHLGVGTKEDGALWAHAWIELPDGRDFGRDERILPF